jgi:hypothetical protein
MQRGGARPATLRVRPYLRERILNFSCAMLVSASPVLVTAPAVFVAVLSLAVPPPCSWPSPSAQVPGWMWARYNVLGLGRPRSLSFTRTPSEVSSKGAVPLTPESCSERMLSFMLSLWEAWPCWWAGEPPPHPTSKKIAASPTTHRSIGIPLMRRRYHRSGSYASYELL